MQDDRCKAIVRLTPSFSVRLGMLNDLRVLSLGASSLSPHMRDVSCQRIEGGGEIVGRGAQGRDEGVDDGGVDT